MILTNDNKYEESRRKQLKIDEFNSVEHPFMEQLKELGWNKDENEVIELQMQQQPSESFRTSFSEVVLMPKLRMALKQIGEQPSRLTFSLFILRKTSRVWSTWTSLQVFLPICVVRIR